MEHHYYNQQVHLLTHFQLSISTETSGIPKHSFMNSEILRKKVNQNVQIIIIVQIHENSINMN